MTPHLASLRMGRTCTTQMLEHADRAFPNECVGFLAGIGGKVSLVIPLANSAGSKSFFVEPYEQYLAEKRMKETQLDLLAIYHSHPYGCACLSEADLHIARRWNAIQVVIAITAACDLSTQVKAFELLPVHGLTEIPIVVD